MKQEVDLDVCRAYFYLLEGVSWLHCVNVCFCAVKLKSSDGQKEHRGSERTYLCTENKSSTRKDLPARETQQTVKAHLHLWEVTEAVTHTQQTNTCT